MRAGWIILAFGALSCGKGQVVDDSSPVEEECTTADDCAGYERCAESVCVEGDDDNSYAEATAIFQVDDLEGDPSATGYIAPAGDVDYFAITSLGNEWIEVRTRATDAEPVLDTVVAIRDASGALHAWMDDYATGSVNGWDSVVQAYLPAAGTWYVTVEHVGTWYADGEPDGGSDFGYDLFVRRYTGGIADPDSATAPGRTITVQDGFIYSAGILLATAGDADWISVTLPHADAPIEVWGQPEIPGSPAVPRVRIHDASDTLLVQKDGVGPEGIANYPLGEAVTYRIEATDAAGGGGAGHWYTLYVRTRDAASTGTVEIEPNDTIGSAQPLSLASLTTSGGSAYQRAWAKGDLDPEGDEDWFAFSATANQYVSVRCNAHDYGTLGAFTLDLYGPGDTLITTVADGTDDYDVANHVVGSDAGTYKLRVSAAGGTPAYGAGAFYNCILFVTPFEAT